jgi:phage shock protein C
MTAPTPGTTAPNQPPYKTLRRPVDDRIVAGVCSGIGRYLNIDPVLVRVALVVLVVISWGCALLAYPIAWFLIPEAGHPPPPTHPRTPGAGGPPPAAPWQQTPPAPHTPPAATPTPAPADASTPPAPRAEPTTSVPTAPDPTDIAEPNPTEHPQTPPR